MLQHSASDFKKIAENPCIFIDTTSWLDNLTHLGNVFYGEKNCGKSTILSMLQYYFDERLHSEELFEPLSCEKSKYFYSRMNHYPVITISFADFNAPDYKSALLQFERIMAEACLPHTDRLLNESYNIETVLRILEGTATEKDLAGSLDILLYTLQRYEEGKTIEPVVLIDDYTNLLIVSQKNGYKDNMLSFCKNWLPGQLNHYTEYFAITGELDLENREVSRWTDREFYHCQEDIFAKSAFDHFYKRFMMLTLSQIEEYCSGHGLLGFEAYLDSPESRRKIAEEYQDILEGHWNTSDKEDIPDALYPIGTIQQLIIAAAADKKTETSSQPKSDENLAHNFEKWVPSESLTSKIKEKREELLCKKQQDEIIREKAIRRHIQDYAAPLPSNVTLPTPFAGIRILPQLPHNAQYEHLTKVIKDLYEVYAKNPKQKLYKIMQAVDEDRPIFLNSGESAEWNTLKENAKGCWKFVDTERYTDSYWYYVKAAKDDSRFDIGPMYIKVTISVKGCRPAEVFIPAIRKLLENAKHEFQAKLTKYERMESMVFWLMRSDFFLLEMDMKDHEKYLIQPLPFIAYRGKLGISRDLYGVGSHHSVQSELLQNYFGRIKKKDDIKIEAIYQYLLDSWNDVLPGTEGCDPFHRSPYVTWDAQMLVILLESLFVILGMHKISDEHIFLNDDKRLWNALGNGPCWKIVGDIWKEYANLHR